MDAKTIEKIAELSEAKTLQIDGLDYTDKLVHLPKRPEILPFQVSSLTAVVDLLEADTDDFETPNYLLHVVSEKRVELRARTSDRYGHRNTLIVSTPVERGLDFRYGNFYPQEEFVIALQALFAASEDLAHVLKTASTLDSQASVRQEDDGVTQRATVKSGIALSSEVTVKRRVLLAPFRTFLEVSQPSSEFIFRVRQGAGGATCALFEADGGAWKIQAIQSVQRWLQNALRGSQVEGLPDLPVIA